MRFIKDLFRYYTEKKILIIQHDTFTEECINAFIGNTEIIKVVSEIGAMLNVQYKLLLDQSGLFSWLHQSSSPSFSSITKTIGHANGKILTNSLASCVL